MFVAEGLHVSNRISFGVICSHFPQPDDIRITALQETFHHVESTLTPYIPRKNFELHGQSSFETNLMRLAMWSSRDTPSSAQPRLISSRRIFAANPGSRSRFNIELGFICPYGIGVIFLYA